MLGNKLQIHKNSWSLSRVKSIASALILSPVLLCSVACSATNISDTKATASIVREICPPVVKIPLITQDQMAEVLAVCLDKSVKLDVFEKNICSEYVYTLALFKVMRDQSRVCWAQK